MISLVAEVQDLSRKNPAIDNIGEWFEQHPRNLAGNASGLECSCVNIEAFTTRVSGALGAIE